MNRAQAPSAPVEVSRSGARSRLDGTWRMLAPALLAWAAAALAIAVPGSGALLVAGGVLAALPLGLLGLRRAHGSPSMGSRGGGPWGALLICAAALLLLGARLLVLEEGRQHPELADAAERGRTISLEVRLSAYPGSRATDTGTRSWLRGTAEGTPVLVWLDGDPDPSWGPGSRLRLAGRPSALPPESDAAFEISARGAVGPVPEHSAPAVDALAEARARLVAASARVPGAELVPGFAVGDTSLVPERLGEQMRAASLTHLTAVSGSNCALITGAIIWVAARLGAGRRTRVLLAGAGLLGFVALIGPDASVLRAAIMAGVMLAGRFGGIPGSGLPALGAAVLLMLIADPWQSRHPGFGLSVLATGGVLLLVPPIESGLRRVARLPRVLALPIAMSVAAQLTCGSGLLLLEPGIPIAGIPANLLAAPAAPLGTGAGLLALLLLGAAEPVGGLAVVVAGWAAHWVATVAEVCDALPLARLEWPGGWIGAALLVLVQGSPAIALALRRGTVGLPGARRAVRRAPWRSPPPVPLAVRIAVAVLGAGSAGVAVAITAIGPLAEGATAPGDWSFVACDVGQGDALLIRDPSVPEAVALIDTGDEPQLLLDCLARFGVGRVSLLVLTHDDRDHVGALDRVLDRVDSALIAPPVGVRAPEPADGADACGPRGDRAAARSVLRTLCGAGIPVGIGTAGRSVRLGSGAEPSQAGRDDGGGVELRVLAPGSGARPADTNAASIVMRARTARFTALLLADTGREEHARLRRSESDLSADLVKVAHHGSRDQDPELAREIGASLAVVSVGAGNRYGHPTTDAIAAHERAGSAVLRTDRLGSIAVSGSREQLAVWAERGNAREAGRSMSVGCPRLEGWQRQEAEPRARSRRWTGSTRVRLRSSSSAGPRASSRIARRAPSANDSPRR